MKNIMKKTNLTTVLYTSLIAGIFVSTTSVAAIPTMELLKAEPIKQSSLKTVAKDSLIQSFSTIEIDTSFAKVPAKTMLAEQKVQSNKNMPITLAKTSLTAD